MRSELERELDLTRLANESLNLSVRSERARADNAEAELAELRQQYAELDKLREKAEAARDEFRDELRAERKR